MLRELKSTIKVNLIGEDPPEVAEKVVQRFNNDGWKEDLARELKLYVEDWCVKNGYKFRVEVSGRGIT